MRSFRGRMILLSVVLLIGGAVEIYMARRDLALATSAGSTQGVVKFDPERKNSSDTIFNTLTARCDFSFFVDGRPYAGHEICPKQIITAPKTSPLDYLGGPVLNVTVYYDPSDPTTNSMMDFGTKSRWDFTKAKLFIVGGLALLLLSLLSIWLSGNQDVAEAAKTSDSESAVNQPEEAERE
jgi:hypothetical protein